MDALEGLYDKVTPRDFSASINTCVSMVLVVIE